MDLLRDKVDVFPHTSWSSWKKLGQRQRIIETGGDNFNPNGLEERDTYWVFYKYDIV